jgi:excisionase family DNA binding protein
MPQTVQGRRYVSMAKAAEYADCSDKTLRRLISQGRITGYKLGRVLRIDLNELDEALKPIPTTKAG